MATQESDTGSAHLAADSHLTNQLALKFFVPMGFSWMLMGLEGPIANFYLTRRPEKTEEGAALLILMSLAFWIESPIVDLLTTANTVADTADNYRVLRRFVLILISILSVLHILVPATSLFNVVTHNLLGIEPDVARRAHTALFMLLPWSAAIGWRRFKQGILIRQGHTKPMMKGTLVRLATLILSGLLLINTTQLPGATLAGAVIASAVCAECLYIHLASSQAVSHVLAQEHTSPKPYHLRSLANFHFPLTATTIVNLMTIPFAAWALSQLHDGVVTKAAFQLSFGLSWILRSYTYGLTEAVITLGKTRAKEAFMKVFCRNVGFFSFGTHLLMMVLGLDMLYYLRFLGEDRAVAENAHQMFMLLVLVPLVTSAQGYYRGVLTSRGQTTSRLGGSICALISYVGCLAIGVHYHYAQPMVLAAGASLLAVTTEWAILYWVGREEEHYAIG